MIFGRGGEEIESIRAAGVACEMVPGITATVLREGQPVQLETTFQEGKRR